MANVFLNLPTNAADGAGAAVDVSALGAIKTVVVSGNGFTFEPAVTIEVSLDAAGAEWSPLWTFLLPGEKTFNVVCRRMRAVVSNFRGGGAPSVDVGGEDDGSTFVSMAVTADDGSGAAANTSLLGPVKTVQVGGEWRGAVNIEISTDGGASFRTAMSFVAGRSGVQTGRFVADFMRVTRTGVPDIAPGTPVVNVGGTDDGGGGGGVTVEDEGVALPGTFTTLNFTGAGVAATDVGGGTADVTIPGITFEEEGVPLAGAPHTVANFLGSGVTVANAGAGEAQITVPASQMSPPEQWVQENVLANQNAVALSAQVSTNFDQIIAPRNGSLTAIVARFTNALTAGTATLVVTVNGVATALSVAITSPNQNGIGLAGPGVVNYVQGDRIGVAITTDGAFAAGLLPAVECWIEMWERAT